MIPTQPHSMSDDERRYTTGDLVRAYMAGVVDASGSFSFQVRQDDTHNIGYSFSVRFMLKKKNAEIVHEFSNWCNEQGIPSRVNVNDGQHVLTISKLDALKDFIETLAPFSRAKRTDFEILREEIIPRIENDEHTTEDGLIEIMGFVERMPSVSTARRKYDQDYFIEEFKQE